MELKIYKGFNLEFLKKLDISEALIENNISEKINVLLFEKQYRKKLDVSLAMLDDEDIKWMTYEEFSLVKDNIITKVKDYELKVNIIVNNLLADVYPIEFNLEEKVYDEIKKVDKDNGDIVLSDEAKKIMSVYSSIIRIADVFYGTFYNYEYDKADILTLNNFYSCDIKVIDTIEHADFTFYINDDLESYVKTFEQMKKTDVKSISICETTSKISKRIVNSLYAYCLNNNIKVFKHYEELKDDDPVLLELINIAKDDLKIPGFKEFRIIKFYKNPDLDNEVVDISQAQIINEIIRQAENSCDESKKYDFRDVFITAFTGAGKSVMFQVPAVYLAKKYKKLTIIIEPVIALMEDQKDSLINRGYSRVEAFNSNLISQVERDNVLKKVKDGEVDLLYLSPETLLSYSLNTIIGDREIGLLIVDEAHIVTTWGVGFRPDYWYLGGYINGVRNVIKSGNYSKDKKIQRFPICAFTATAINGGYDDSVNQTIISLYMNNPIKFIGYARRDDIDFNITIKDESKLGMSEYDIKKGKDLISRVDTWIKNKEKTIVYFPYASYANDAYNNRSGFCGAKYNKTQVGLYTGRDFEDSSLSISKIKKQETFEKFKKGNITVMFATKAFGMGVDVNDILNVYHYATTGNLCDYVQEIGRAARKTGMQGHAITDFYRNDLIFMQKLFGMSQIRQYQINKVLSGIYDVYKNKDKRSFLISPQSFTYIFGGSYDEGGSINKLKTCLLMLEKDFYDKYNFKVLVSRPQSIFTKAYVCVDSTHSDFVLKSKYGTYFKFEKNGRNHEKISTKSTTRITDVGDIYSINLKEIWEKFYSNLSFPQFKFWYFANKTYTGKDKVEVLKEIQPFIFPRQKVIIQVKNNKVFNDLRPAIIDDLNYISNSLYSNFKGKYFTLDEFASIISPQYGMTKAKIISNSIFDIVDPSHKVVKIRTYDENNSTTYTLANGTFGSILLNPIIKSKFVKSFINNFEFEFSQFMSISSENIEVIALKILSIFDYISYELIGGEEPEIFVRLNDPFKVEGIVNGAIKYVNNYVLTAKDKHDRDVKILYKFFDEVKSKEQRWDYIEKYFLGYNVLEEDSSPSDDYSKISLKKMIDDIHSSPSISYKDWNSAAILFEDSQLPILQEFARYSIPLPSYFHTKIKGNPFSEDPIMAWPEKNVLIFGSDATDSDIALAKNKGWTAFKIFELDVKKLLKEVI